MPLKKQKSKVRPSSSAKERSIIGLLSDFGLQDHYVSVMKGILLSLNSDAEIIDVTHNVQPYHVRQASYLLWSAYQFFPKGTIFVCVVDPGVGSKRHILGLQTQHYTFIAPENGLLDFILNQEKIGEYVEITEQSAKKYIRKEVSSTFHGRDLFAPIAAQLSKGVKLQQVGTVKPPPVVGSPFVATRSETLQSLILHVDQFGNIITNISTGDYVQSLKSIQAISVGRNLVSRWIRFYDEAPDNTPCLIVGSNGLIEISVKRGSAAQMLNANLDTQIKIYWR
jgi:S-adenosyl-L-methionine hydrolase (adenosine-forming)